MKALTLHQPWASLIAAGIKTIETRPCPPNGPMRPDGVRGLPGRSIKRGERIAIHAGTALARGFFPIDYCRDVLADRTVTRRTWRLPNGHEIDSDEIDLPSPLPRGAVVATASVFDALPMVERFVDYSPPCIVVEADELTWFDGADYWGEAQECSVNDQRPYGDFAQGRWAWMLTDIEPCQPIPVRGAQGVWWLPDDLAAQIRPAAVEAEQ